MWGLTEFIGLDQNGEELYVFVSRLPVMEREEALAFNKGFHKSGSNLRYYEANHLPGKIVTEREALPWRREPVRNWPPKDFVTWLYGTDENK